MRDHSLVETEQGDTLVYRCKACGLMYKSKDTFNMFVCTGISEEDIENIDDES